MSLKSLIAFGFSLNLFCAAALSAAPAPAQRPVAESCASEAAASDSLAIAEARIKAAEADLNLNYAGRCRPEALTFEQHAYLALEDLEKQAGSETDRSARAAHLQVIHDAMADLRSAEQAVQQSIKDDPRARVGIDVTPLDNALHTLGSYGASKPTGAPVQASSSSDAGACERLPESEGTAAEKIMARLATARADLGGKYRGRCREPALALLDGAGRELEVLQDSEAGKPTFPDDKAKQRARLAALDRARKYQMQAAQTVKDALAKDPQGGHIGVNVTPIDNALATLKAAYGG